MYITNVNMKDGNWCSNKPGRMLTRIWIFSIVFLNAVGLHRYVRAAETLNTTTCEEFETGALFDPYKIVDSMWKIIYFWSDTSEINPIIFSLPAKKRLERFKEVVDAVEPHLGVEWHKVRLLMEPRPGVMVVLMDAGTPGAFRALVKQEQRNKVRPNPEPLIKLADIRMKIEGRYLGMMCCEDLTAFAMARVDEVPPTEEECEAAAATLGLKGPGGRSYLYLKKNLKTEL